ncbi:hypothetical protein NFJ02_30g78250 [Pycnococcus provasolii]
MAPLLTHAFAEDAHAHALLVDNLITCGLVLAAALQLVYVIYAIYGGGGEGGEGGGGGGGGGDETEGDVTKQKKET